MVRNFLFSRANREFLIFLFFFAVAGVFWLLMALNETYEQELRVPLHYTGVPKNAVLTSPETDTLRVTVSDKGYVLASYMFGDALRPLSADFKTYARQSGKGTIPAADLMKMVSARLAASSKVVAIKPDHLTFFYNYGEKKRVPVRYRGTVVPEDLYFIAGVEYMPDSVTIYATREKLDSITTAYTDALHHTGFRDTLTLSVGLQRMAGVKMVPEEVTVRFLTDVLTEESIDGVPVIGINMPQGKVLRTFPAKVRVTFVTGMKTYRTLTPEDFRVVADYNELRKNPSAKCNIYIESVPNGISRTKLDTTFVDYLIEEQPDPQP